LKNRSELIGGIPKTDFGCGTETWAELQKATHRKIAGLTIDLEYALKDKDETETLLTAQVERSQN